MELIEPYMNYIYLGGVLLGLMLFAWLMIRTFGGKVRAKRGARLGISEYYEVDKSRFLVIVRRDDVEHLVLIGGNQDLVIEQGIGMVKKPYDNSIVEAVAATEKLLPQEPAVSLEPDFKPNNIRPITSRPAPRPPVFSEPKPNERAPNLRAVERDPELD